MDGASSAPRINGTNIQTGIDEDGWYTVKAGKKGQTYHVLFASPMSAENIIRLRESVHLSHKELAEALGVAESTVYSWERGDEIPDTIASRLLDMLNRGLMADIYEKQNDTDR